MPVSHLKKKTMSSFQIRSCQVFVSQVLGLIKIPDSTRAVPGIPEFTKEREKFT